MSVAAATKTAIIAALVAAQGDSTTLAAATITYGPPRTLMRVYIYGGAIQATMDWAGMRAGSKPRDESATVDLHVGVRLPGGDAADVEDQAVDLVGAIGDTLAADVTLSGGVSGLRWCGVSGYELESWPDDEAWTCEATVHVSVSGRLS